MLSIDLRTETRFYSQKIISSFSSMYLQETVPVPLYQNHVQFIAWVAGLLLPPANEVWGKVIFLHLSVILFTGRGYLGRYTPPRDQEHPLDQKHPLTRFTPRAVHAGKYGQQAGSMYPTGMHSCVFVKVLQETINLKSIAPLTTSRRTRQTVQICLIHTYWARRWKRCWSQIDLQKQKPSKKT